MKIEFKYPKGLYHFIWIKGIIEILLSFIILYAVAFDITLKIDIFVFILLFVGVKDLQYFLKLKENKKR